MVREGSKPHVEVSGLVLAVLGSLGGAGTQLWEEGKRRWSEGRSGAEEMWLGGPLMGPQNASSQAVGVTEYYRAGEHGEGGF